MSENQTKPKHLIPWACPQCGADCSGNEQGCKDMDGAVGYYLKCECGCEFTHWESVAYTPYCVEVDGVEYEYPQQAGQPARTKFPYLADQLERLYGLGAAGSILELMEATWANHGAPGEPYTDVAACEIALNELIDYAREHGCRVTFDNTEIGSPHGVCVHPPQRDGGAAGKSYRVVYEIDVCAASPEEAARQVDEILRDPESIPPVFTIRDSDGRRTTVDLYEQGLTERWGPTASLDPADEGPSEGTRPESGPTPP